MKNNVSNKQLRDFGLLIGFGFPLIIGWFIPYVTGHEFRIWSLLVGLFGLFFGLVNMDRNKAFDLLENLVKKYVIGKEYEGVFLKPRYGDASGVRGAARLGRSATY